MVFVWIVLIWLILMIIRRILTWNRKENVFISKEDMRKYNDRMKMSIRERLKRKRENYKNDCNRRIKRIHEFLEE